MKKMRERMSRKRFGR